MMTFTELSSPNELMEFLNANSTTVITFSATWCGPCKASKPELVEFAAKSSTSKIPIGYVHEEDLEDFLHVFVKLKTFPTYILFQNGNEISRVEGVNFAELEKMVNNAAKV